MAGGVTHALDSNPTVFDTVQRKRRRIVESTAHLKSNTNSTNSTIMTNSNHGDSVLDLKLANTQRSAETPPRSPPQDDSDAQASDASTFSSHNFPWPAVSRTTSTSTSSSLSCTSTSASTATWQTPLPSPTMLSPTQTPSLPSCRTTAIEDDKSVSKSTPTVTPVSQQAQLHKTKQPSPLRPHNDGTGVVDVDVDRKEQGTNETTPLQNDNVDGENDDDTKQPLSPSNSDDWVVAKQNSGSDVRRTLHPNEISSTQQIDDFGTDTDMATQPTPQQEQHEGKVEEMVTSESTKLPKQKLKRGPKPKPKLTKAKLAKKELLKSKEKKLSKSKEKKLSKKVASQLYHASTPSTAPTTKKKGNILKLKLKLRDTKKPTKENKAMNRMFCLTPPPSEPASIPPSPIATKGLGPPPPAPPPTPIKPWASTTLTSFHPTATTNVPRYRLPYQSVRPFVDQAALFSFSGQYFFENKLNKFGRTIVNTIHNSTTTSTSTTTTSKPMKTVGAKQKKKWLNANDIEQISVLMAFDSQCLDNSQLLSDIFAKDLCRSSKKFANSSIKAETSVTIASDQSL